MEHIFISSVWSVPSRQWHAFCRVTCSGRNVKVSRAWPGVVKKYAVDTYHPDQIVAPTLLLLSNDEALAEFVLGVVKAPWRLIHHDGGGTRMSDGSFAEPNVRLVILDDQAVEENDRSWLLTRIRKRLPGASLLYVAGNQSDTNEKRARANGAHYYVSKPLSFERFGYVLQSFLRSKKH